MTGCQPHPHAGGNGNHDLCFRPAALQGGAGRSTTSRIRFKALVSMPAPTRTSRPFPSSISMRSSVCVASVGGQVCASGEGAGFPCGAIAAAPAGGEDMVTGTKTAALRRAWPSRASRRQRNSRLGLMPCRRATAEIFAPGCAASATIACFSASLHCRRVSATTEYRREIVSGYSHGTSSCRDQLAPTRATSYPPRKAVFGVGIQNIYPREVEEVLYRCPGVQEAGVIGLNDEKWGQIVMAVVVRSDPELTAETNRRLLQNLTRSGCLRAFQATNSWTDCR